MTLMMTSALVVETSVNVTNNSPSRDYSHPNDQTTQTIVQSSRFYPTKASNTYGLRTIYGFIFSVHIADRDL